MSALSARLTSDQSRRYNRVRHRHRGVVARTTLFYSLHRSRHEADLRALNSVNDDEADGVASGLMRLHWLIAEKAVSFERSP